MFVSSKALPLTLFIALAAPCAMAQLAPGFAVPPSEQEAFAEWQRQLVPGMYEFKEFSIDAEMTPVEGSVKTKRQCVNAKETEQIAKMPLTTTFVWGCKPSKVHLQADRFVISMACPDDDASGHPINAMAAIGKSNATTFDSRAIKSSVNPQTGEQTLLFGAGSTFLRVGDCE